MAYRCFKCKSTDLRISCEIICDLRSVPEHEPVPIKGALTTWDDNSWTVCQQCGTEGPAKAFEDH